MTEILDHSTIHNKAGEISKSSIKFKAGSFDSIVKIINAKETIKTANECTQIRNKVKQDVRKN